VTITPSLGWISRPFAHRGLHDANKGIVENTASSIRAALDHDYGIEVDLRRASCGTVMVFHDDQLERLTHGKGTVTQKSKKELQKIAFRNTKDKMLSLQDLLALVDGRVPLLLEIKSDWNLDTTALNTFVHAIVTTLQDYEGLYAVMSFDPALIHSFRLQAPSIPRGLVSENFQERPHWQQFGVCKRVSLRFLLSFPQTRPDFIAYDIKALPAIAPIIARRLFHRKLITWTVRTKEQQQRAEKYCDAIIFETFLPNPLPPNQTDDHQHRADLDIISPDKVFEKPSNTSFPTSSAI
jgi:glycerophosphoryl diester phosphodiesterase